MTIGKEQKSDVRVLYYTRHSMRAFAASMILPKGPHARATSSGKRHTFFSNTLPTRAPPSIQRVRSLRLPCIRMLDTRNCFATRHPVHFSVSMFFIVYQESMSLSLFKPPKFGLRSSFHPQAPQHELQSKR